MVTDYCCILCADETPTPTEFMCEECKEITCWTEDYIFAYVNNLRKEEEIINKQLEINGDLPF